MWLPRLPGKPSQEEPSLSAGVGVEFGAQGTFETPYAFTGEPLDANGLVYLRARYYSPVLGVFPSLDPNEAINQYQYAFSNPVRYIDPSGHQEEDAPKPIRMCRDLPQPLRGYCLSEALELGASWFEAEIDASNGPLGPLDPNDPLRWALEQEWIYAAHFMYLYLGFYSDPVAGLRLRNPWNLGENRYFNICRMLQESPEVAKSLEENFIKCVLDSDTSHPPCIVAGSQVAGRQVFRPSGFLPAWATGVPGAASLEYQYENPYWRFRLGFDSILHPDLNRALGTFSVRAHTNSIVVTYDTNNQQIVYQAFLGFWDNYDWVNNDDPNAQGFHPFGMLATDFESVEEVGLAKPYTMFSGLIYTVRFSYQPCTQLPCQTYSSSMQCVHPPGESTNTYISRPLATSGFMPFHSRENTDNVLHYP